MSLTLEQLALIAQVKRINAPALQQAARKERKQGKARKGHCKPLPLGPLTPKASESRWALLAKGTDTSQAKACDNTDARPKAQLGDRRLMREVSCVNPEDQLYKVDASLDLIGLFTEFLKIRKLRADREACTALEGRLNAQQYRLMRRALKRGELDRVSAILEQALNLNQIK